MGTVPGYLTQNPDGLLPDEVFICEPGYATPDGYIDSPYIYTSNLGTLPNALPYQQRVPMEGDADFVLRRVTGFTYCGLGPTTTAKGGFRLYSPSNQPTMSDYAKISWNYTQLPELVYSKHGQLRYDISTLDHGVNEDTLTAQMAFQGVKRFRVDQPGAPLAVRSRYKYFEKPYTYRVDFTLGAGGLSEATRSSPVRLRLVVDDFDFELWSIRMSEANGNFILIPSSPCQVMLYNSQSVQLMSSPVNINYVAEVGSRAEGFQQFASIFPVPGIVYPMSSIIALDMWSTLEAASAPRTYSLLLMGVQRLPC